MRSFIIPLEVEANPDPRTRWRVCSAPRWIWWQAALNLGKGCLRLRTLQVCGIFMYDVERYVYMETCISPRLTYVYGLFSLRRPCSRHPLGEVDGFAPLCWSRVVPVWFWSFGRTALEFKYCCCRVYFLLFLDLID